MTTEEFQNAVIAISLCNFLVNLQILEIAQEEKRNEENGNNGRSKREI